MSTPSVDRLLLRAYLVAIIVAALLVPVLLRANMADPVDPGDRVGEPAAALAGVVVERERLEMDLRPLERRESAVVEAVYRLRNDGPARELELVFVADALADSGRVTLDGRPVPVAESRADTALPARWLAPRSTPGIGRDAPLPYEAGAYGEAAGTLRFRLPLKPGRHTVAVRYRARATEHSHSSPVVNWQLGYVMAPARRWADFGGMDLRVRVPAGWSAAAEPALRREGDVLTGSWDALPADALALTVRAPEPRSLGLWLGLAALAAAGVALCVWAGVRAGRTLARRGRGPGWAALPAAGLALVWATGVMLGIIAIPPAVAERAGLQAAAVGYGAVVVAVLGWPVLFLFALGTGLVAALREHRRTSRLAADPVAG